MLHDHSIELFMPTRRSSDLITALQMDIKIGGINAQIMAEALEQAKKGRLYILGAMEKTIAAPRENISAHAPRIIQIKINPDRKSTRLNSSHLVITYAVFCLK